MDEIKQPATIANGGIVFLSASDKDEKEDEKHPGYIYYYYLNNCTLSGPLDGKIHLVHYETKSSVVSSRYQSDGGDVYVCLGSKYDRADDAVMSGVFDVLHISSGAVANNAVITNKACDVVFYVYSGGTANSTTISIDSTFGYATIYGGGFANDTILNNGRLNIYGYANGVTVNSGGSLLVRNGGTATRVRENGGYVEGNATFAPNSFSGVVLANHLLSGVTFATVHSGTTGISTTIGGRCGLGVYSGGLALDTVISSGGSLFVYSDGEASVATLVANAALFVSGGVVNSAKVYGGELYVNSDSIANNATINGGNLRVYGGGLANKTTVNANGLHVYSDGEARETTVNSGGTLYVYSDGLVNNATVNLGGRLVVSNGGTATHVMENGGFVTGAVNYVPNTFSGLEISSTSASVHSGTIGNDTTLNSGGCLYVYSGGVLNRTMVNAGYMYHKNGGSLFLYDGALASETTVNSDGRVFVSNGGVMIDATVNANGSIVVFDGGIASDARINDTGYIGISSGGVASCATVQGGGLHVSLGGIASETTINAGVLIASNGGLASVTTINGGRLNVSSGGSADDVMVNIGGFLTISSGGTATHVKENGGFVNGAADYDPNSFSGVEISRTSASVHSGTTAIDTTLINNGYFYVYNGGIANSTVVKSIGYLYLSNGGAANSTVVNSGGTVFLSSGGTANGTIINAGATFSQVAGGVNSNTILNGGSMHANNGSVVNNLTINGGAIELRFDGILTLCSASLTASIRNWGFTVNFLVNSATPGDDILFGNYSKYSNNGSLSKYAITVDGGQQTGDYILLCGAGGFSYNVTVTNEDMDVLGTFVWNKGTDTFNPLEINGRKYTLKKKSNNLVLTVAPGPTYVNYDFTDIEQTVYYDGPAPEGSGLSGTLMMIPYTADITMTFDKSLSEGEYEFTTSVAEVPGSVNNCKFQIADAEDVPDLNGEYNKWSVAYISHDACHYGMKIGETDTTVTYKFTDVSDYLLIDSIPDETLDIDVANDAANTDELVLNTSNDSVTYYSGEYSDVNKKLVVGKLSGNGIMNNKDKYSFSIVKTGAYGKRNTYYYSGEYTIGGKKYSVLDITGNKETISFTMNPDLDADVFISIKVDRNTLKIVSIDRGNDISSLNGIQVEETIERDITEKSDSYSIFAPWDDEHCWIAVTANMLATAGYLSEDLTAKKCYELLNENYSIKPGGNPTEIFKSYSVPFKVYKDNDKWFDNIAYGLAHIEKGKAVGAIGLEGGNFIKGKFFHIITCYRVSFNSKLNEGTITYTDSDDPSDNIHSEPPKEAKIRKKWNGSWVVEIYEQSCTILGIITMIPNNSKDKRLTESDFKSYKPIDENNSIHAQQYSGISSTSNGVTVSEEIYDSVVQDDGNLTIASGAEAEEMVVHGGGTVQFNSGSIAKGTIRTTGGTLTVESGVDVSEAEFDFAVSYMDEANDVPMLNSLSNVSGAMLTITVVNGQKAGKYVLAGGTTGFNGTLSVIGELDFMQAIGEGFEDGLIGELGLDNTLSIEGRTYSLVLEEDNLALVISAKQESPLGIVGDFNGDGKSMLVTESDGVVSVYADGAAWGGLTLDDGWYVAGIGDFNGDGADDFLRVNEEGYVVGEMSNGNGTFSPQVLNFLNDGWDILGIGDFNGNGTDDVLIANPTAASETVGLLGYWESGSTWTLINGYSAEWECIATGDFNGDGKCDMLWRNYFEGDGGLTYNAYCTWIVDNPVDWRMVSVANPDEWDFLCSGDFDGNKMNDIAMINNEGVVGIWGVNDGYLSSWSILSAVTSEWTLAGVGDFNADGTDDIAWCNTETGLVGCWRIENRELAFWNTIAAIG